MLHYVFILTDNFFINTFFLFLSNLKKKIKVPWYNKSQIVFYKNCFVIAKNKKLLFLYYFKNLSNHYVRPLY